MSNSSTSTSVLFPIRLVNEINSKCCSVLGALLNLVLIWLVLKKTPKEMQMYSKIILQTCISDLAMLALAEIVQPIAFVSNGVLMLVENGVSIHAPHPLNIVLYDLWLFATFFGISGLVVQFLYRYLVLCRGQKLGAREYYLLLVGAVAFEALVLGLFFWIGYPPLGEQLLLDRQVLSLIGENPADPAQKNQLRLVLYGDKSDIRWLLWNVFGFANNTICYSLIVFCGLKMVVHVKKNLAKANKRAAEINRQMTLNMLFQATLPVLDVSVFTTVLVACVAPPSDFLICLLMLLCASLNWVPVLNPLITIATVAPYRRTIVRIGAPLPSGTSQMNNQGSNVRVGRSSRVHPANGNDML